MDGGIDVRLVLTVVGMLVSVVSAAVIVKQKLASVIEQLDALKKDYEARLRTLDHRTDKQENAILLNQQKNSVLSGILSPTALEKSHREIERILVLSENNADRIKKLEAMHNGRHPYCISLTV